MASQNKIDEIGKWSENKLMLLTKYLNAYTEIMKNQSWCKGYYYIDAFAGTGRPKAKEEERFIEGSPRCALKVKHSFTRYYFIEKTDWRYAELLKIKKGFSHLNIEIRNGDCNKILTKEIYPLLPYDSFKRALLFLDPFGMNVNWNIIEQAAKSQTIEIILNMPIMAINRVCLLNEHYNLTSEHIEKMNNFWGNNDWQNKIYENTNTLFGITKAKRKALNAKELSSYFVERLQSVFTEVSLPLIMRNSKNSPLYCLIYAGHQQKAKKIIEEIFNFFEKSKENNSAISHI